MQEAIIGLAVTLLGFPFTIAFLRPNRFEMTVTIWSVMVGAASLLAVGYWGGFTDASQLHYESTIDIIKRSSGEIVPTPIESLPSWLPMAPMLAIAYWQVLKLFGFLYVDSRKSGESPDSRSD